MEIKIFENEQFGRLEVIDKNGDPWFYGKDIAERLGYTNPRDALTKHVDEDDKGVAKRDTLGGEQAVTIINESGLYSLILTSKLPTAKQFKRWVTNEILPTVRKHGMYATAETAEKILNDPDFLIKNAGNPEGGTGQARSGGGKDCSGCSQGAVCGLRCSIGQRDQILVGELAKLLKQNGMDIGQNRLYDRLRQEGYIMKNSTIPTQRSMELGLFRVIERSIVQPNGTTWITQTTKVTGKGQQYFVSKYIGSEV